MRGNDLKRLKLHIGNSHRATGTDEYLATNKRQVFDLPIFGRDGEYCSRTLRRVWIEVRGKTYESHRDQYDFFHYCRHADATSEIVLGKEAANKLRALLNHLPRAIRSDVADLLAKGDEVEHRRWERYRIIKILNSRGRRVIPLPLP